MASQLDLSQVLEEEFLKLHGPMPPWSLLMAQLEDPVGLMRKLRDPRHKVSQYLKARLPDETRRQLEAWDGDRPSDELWTALVSQLDELLRSGESLYEKEAFADVSLSEHTSQLIKRQSRGDAIIHLNRLLLRDAYPDETTTPLAAIYKLIHQRARKDEDSTRRTALCLSGGGIRSATFGLGILQELARQNLLDKFDYLSTVSGGGYLGGWLTAWIHRHRKGLAGVIEELKKRPVSPLDPEPGPIRHLRDYSNYLSPKLGLLSADTWTLVATYLRNLLLNWFVLIPLLIAVLAIPRISVAVVRWDAATAIGLHVWWLLGVGALMLVTALVYMGLFRPSLEEFRNRRGDLLGSREGQRGFLAFCLLPFLGAAIFTSAFWAWLNHTGDGPEQLLQVLGAIAAATGLKQGQLGLAFGFIGFGALLHVVGWIFCSFLLGRWKPMEFLVVLATGALGGVLGWGAATQILPGRPVEQYVEYYVCFAAPLILTIVLLAATLFVGLLSYWTNDEDREWWSRFGAWVLIAIVGWSAISSLVIFGPLALLWLKTVISVGAVSSLITIGLGSSSKTSVSNKQPEQAKLLSVVMNHAVTIAAPVFAAFLVVMLSLGTSALMKQLFPIIGGLDHLEVIRNSSIKQTAGLAFAAAIIAFLLAFFININKFSLHAMYRSRLIRAYLGASRLRREQHRNPFTGFDPLDNLQMHELRPELVDVRSFDDLERLIVELQSPDPLAGALRAAFGRETQQMLRVYRPGRPVSTALRQALIDDLNAAICAPTCVFPAKLVTAPRFSAGTVTWCGQNPQGDELIRLNRVLLEEAFPKYIVKYVPGPQRPFHVINIALNLVVGKKLAWQERKAESFTVTHLHSGSLEVGYRRSREYGSDRKPYGISLGTAVTISGAAASPNMGYHSSPVVAFLMTLFNARLGWWLGNPGACGERTFRQASPTFSIGPMVAEALGLTDDTSRYVYLSDGGHFENLGLYEMVLRRCHFILVVDAGCDPEGRLEDLGNAIRKIRIDLGVPITLMEFPIYPREAKKSGKYSAVGTINYSAVDGSDGIDGTLVYIKPAFYGEEPKDIFNYAQVSAAFPHEPTSDQWFSESQFESYRALGEYAVKLMCGEGRPATDLSEFRTRIGR